LPARQAGRFPAPEALQPQEGEVTLNPLFDLRAGKKEVLRAEGHLQLHVGGKELGLKILQDESHVAGHFRHLVAGHLPVLYQDPPLVPSPEKMGDDPVQRERKGWTCPPLRAPGSPPATHPEPPPECAAAREFPAPGRRMSDLRWKPQWT
jgi:hypothetical protein